MDKAISWVNKALRAWENLDEYTDEERDLIFTDINAEYAHFDGEVQIQVKNVILSNLDMEVAMTFLSVLIQNGAAEYWAPFYIQIAENLELDNKLLSTIELHLNGIKGIDRNDLQSFHDRNVMRWKKQISIRAKWKTVQQRNAKRIVIVTEQLLSELHAPTKAVLELAYLLQHKMHYEVMIISTPIDVQEICSIWNQAFWMQNIPEYSEKGIKREYKGEMFYGYQMTMSKANNADYSLLLSYILEWNPLFVFNFGLFNPVMDLLADYTTVVARSMTTKLPISKAQFLVGLQNKEDTEIRDFQKIVSFEKTSLSFEPAKRVHTRLMYQMEENQFLCVIVGNRLEEDVDESFVQMLHEISVENERIAFVFIGKVEKKKEELQKQIPDRQLYFIDYCDDLMGIYQIMNLYVNPRRQGGGYSAAMAIAAGLPVITCDYGDVAYHVGTEFSVSDYEKMEQEVLHYAENSAYNNEKKRQAEERAKDMTEDNTFRVMEDNINKLIKEIYTGGIR